MIINKQRRNKLKILGKRIKRESISKNGNAIQDMINFRSTQIEKVAFNTNLISIFIGEISKRE